MAARGDSEYEKKGGTDTKMSVENKFSQQIRVLHVDDEAAILALTREFLKREGREEFEIISVLSAAEALAKLTQERFDAIISDYKMPEMDGLEFLDEVRKTEDVIPFVLFSGMATPEVVTEAFKKGADRYISKAGNPASTWKELALVVRELVKEKKGMEIHWERAEEFLRVVAR